MSGVLGLRLYRCGVAVALLSIFFCVCGHLTPNSINFNSAYIRLHFSCVLFDCVLFHFLLFLLATVCAICLLLPFKINVHAATGRIYDAIISSFYSITSYYTTCITFHLLFIVAETQSNFKICSSIVGLWGLRLAVWVLQLGVRSLGFGVCALGFGVCNLRFEVCSLGFRLWGLGFATWGWGFAAWGLGPHLRLLVNKIRCHAHNMNVLFTIDTYGTVFPTARAQSSRLFLILAQ